jgi:hypothetical protein
LKRPPPMPTEPKRYEVPPEANRVPCRACGALMVFVKTEKGKTCPVNEDGTSHFSTCPEASRFSKKRAP